ncbi:MAG TPA: TfoX/Sxy family protein [Rhizomicrobium sp.]|nr:TfoX/Sxy family protein [Rhizomicrobium sp.]HWC62746.1 TfoX/Sxy family protein [Rhizomicrobium sp.]
MAAPDPRRFDDLFGDFGTVALRRLFSGEGIYADGRIIGVVIEDRIYLKTDEATRPAFTAERCRRFYFRKDGKRIASSYYAIPERLYDDPAELAQWARQALHVACAAPKKKPRSGSG